MNIGILGAGNIAEKMAYTLSQMDDAKSYAVGARALERAEAFAGKYGIQHAYGSYAELVQDENIDLVYIATPHSHHYEHAMLCLEHGKPVLCEKAFMANAKQAKEVIGLAEEKGIFITEAIWIRYMPSRFIIGEVIASGAIGEVTSVTANLGYDIKTVPRLQKPELAGGALLDVGVYPINFVSMILGKEVEEVISACTKTVTGVDGQNAIIMKYKDGKLATLHSGMLAATEQYGIVYGTKGYLIAENINNVTKVNIYTPDRMLQREIRMPEQITGFEDQVRASMKAIKEGKLECEEMPHAESIRIMELMDNLRNSWGIQFPFEG